jgi:hypothetical protein
VRILIVLFLLFATSTPQQTTSQDGNQSDSGNGASAIFSAIEPAVRRQSRVPLRLPSFLPDYDRAHPIDAILQSVDKSGYEFLLAFDPNCQGQNWCLYGSVRGSVSRRKLGSDTGVPLTLRHGIKGWFFESVCHAYCNQAYVEWKENGFYYAIGIKAGKQEQLIRAANSAIP